MSGARGDGSSDAGARALGTLVDDPLDEALLERAGEELSRRGADNWEVFAAYGRSTAVAARSEGRIEASLSDGAGLGLRVLVGGRPGFAFAGSLSWAAVQAACGLCIESAQLMEVDEHVSFAERSLDDTRPLDVYHAELLQLSLEEQVEIARALAIDAARQAQVEALYLDNSVYFERLVTSAGARFSARSTTQTYEACMLAGAGGDRGRGHSYGISSRALDLAALTREASQQANAMVDAGPVASGRYDVVLAPAIVEDLLSDLCYALSGYEALAGRTMFAELVGERVGSDLIDLVDDPLDPRLGFARYDHEGTPHQKVALISGGVLQTLLYDRSTASRAGVANTAHAERGSYESPPTPGVSALRLAPGDRSVDELLAEMGDGLHLVDTTDVEIDASSGELSAGASGFVVRHGQRAEPLDGIVLSASIVDLLCSVRAVGSDLRYSGFATPSLLVEGLEVAGT